LIFIFCLSYQEPLIVAPEQQLIYEFNFYANISDIQVIGDAKFILLCF